ncbi:MAG: NAD(P)H-dependent oxidoreductase [Rhizobiaceae bacterium]
MIPKILVFAGSIRTGAYSVRTAEAAARTLAGLGAEVTFVSLADYPMPLMNQDLEREEGIPDNAMRLGRMVAQQDGLLIATPEYNASIPPLLKNTIDWLSRISGDGGKPLKPFADKIAALCSSSTGKFGGIRAIAHLRPICMNVGLEVITPQCSVGNAADAFDEAGELTDERSRNLMEKTCRTLCQHAALLSTRR